MESLNPPATRDGHLLKAAALELRELLAPHAERTAVHCLPTCLPT